MGPTSDAVNVNIILRNNLEEWLRTWYAQRVPYEEMANRINTLIADEARKSGAEPSVYSRQAIQRWCHEMYGLGKPRR